MGKAMDVRVIRELLFDLVDTYTPPGFESRLHPVLERWVERLGYEESYVDDVGNFFARRGRGSTTILLASHLDTVPGRLEAGADGEEVWGRGAVDAKGSLASMLLGASLAVKEVDGLKTYVAGLVGEEADGRGARHLIETGFRAEHIVIGEPTSLGVAVAYRGSLSLKTLAKARGGHTSAPYMGESALDKLLEFLKDVKAHYGGKSYEEPTSAVTVLRAGDWPGSLPESAEARINIRFPTPMTAEEVLENVKGLAARWGVAVEVVGIDEPVEVKMNAPVVRALIRGLLRTGVKPRLVKKTGTSDMNLLKKITSSIAAFGPGDSRLAHTRKERIKLKEVERAAHVLASTLSELAKHV